RDLARWLSPLLASRFSPGVDWWKCCYLGFVASGCAVAGLFALPRARALILGAWVAAVFLLTLGGCFPPSCWLWAHCVLLRFVRYPGNMAYLALLPLSLLAAAGLDRMRAPLRGLLAAAICAELSLLAWRAMPRAARAELSNPGPLARRLQGELDGGRYLLSPLALEAVSGSSVPDWRQRLYGLTNAPSKLRAASNFGEPLVPQANYALMDRLLSAPSAAAAAALLPWLDVRVLLSPKPVHGPGLAPAGRTLWFVSRVRGASDAWLLPFAAGTALGPGSLALPASARPIPVERGREDAFSARGDKSGWLFVAEPLYPGWRVWLETPRGPGLAFPMPAFGPFQKLAVPVGRWTLHWRYRPRSFSWGLALTLCAALALGFPWLGRLRAANFHDA
ncbi:MAG: hypothetical protein KGK30_01690, partial [Elusimicrobia bacterium]|nr:hypothetical protein [Elusimicrobiota bacterium]